MFIDKSLKEWFSMPHWDTAAIEQAENKLKYEAYDILINEESWHIEKRNFVLNDNIGAVYSLAQELSNLGIDYWEQYYYIKQIEKEKYSKDFIQENIEELERIKKKIKKELDFAIYRLFSNELEYLEDNEGNFTFNLNDYTYYDSQILYQWSVEAFN